MAYQVINALKVVSQRPQRMHVGHLPRRVCELDIHKLLRKVGRIPFELPAASPRLLSSNSTVCVAVQHKSTRLLSHMRGWTMLRLGQGGVRYRRTVDHSQCSNSWYAS